MSYSAFILFQEASKTFIKPEDVDAAIEYALANPVDFNYAIDLKQNIYHGRFSEAKPPQNRDFPENTRDPKWDN